ncbi:MAG TPA: hypothetical protein VI488_04325 [Candidatus Angelobacter sp.]
MVTLAHQAGQTASSGTAKRLRHLSVNPPASRTLVMKVVVCGQCGERFAIGHEPASSDPALAERQAIWLEEHFVWDHIQENKHRGSIALPAARELK